MPTTKQKAQHSFFDVWKTQDEISIQERHVPHEQYNYMYNNTTQLEDSLVATVLLQFPPELKLC